MTARGYAFPIIFGALIWLKQLSVVAFVLPVRSGGCDDVFQVRQRATGAILWTESAFDEIGALDAMAHEAGCYDHSDIPESVRSGGLTAEAVRV